MGRWDLVCRARFTPYPLLEQIVSDIGEQKIFGVAFIRVRLTEDRYCTQFFNRD